LSFDSELMYIDKAAIGKLYIHLSSSFYMDWKFMPFVTSLQPSWILTPPSAPHTHTHTHTHTCT
jgi:hypothetical protein